MGFDDGEVFTGLGEALSGLEQAFVRGTGDGGAGGEEMAGGGEVAGGVEVAGGREAAGGGEVPDGKEVGVSPAEKSKSKTCCAIVWVGGGTEEGETGEEVSPKSTICCHGGKPAI